jgi:ribulose kinase
MFMVNRVLLYLPKTHILPVNIQKIISTAYKKVVKDTIEDAKANQPGFNPDDIIGIGVDTTGSTPIR